MKRRELEEALGKLGWRLLRHGAKHDVWTNGEQQEPVPRHTDINEKLARAILRRASRRG
jgi:mRNA interferase HicA